MAVFVGKQPNYPDPNLAHASILEPYDDDVEFTGKQPSAPTPTVSGKVTRRPEDNPEGRPSA